MTDEQFNEALKRIRKKDKDALKEIYEEYIGFIYHVILDIVKNRETAEDNTSEFFIKLWEKDVGYSPGKGHKGFLATMARNMAIDHLRKYKKEELMPGLSGDDDPPDDLELAADTKATPEEEVVGSLSVEQALEKLKPIYRQIITMKVLADMTFKEIASVLDMPMGTVTWNYREAIKQLRRFGYD
ncbi:MAG: sigma-70 family RNA polymerase sigma factor [Lachnospiraceae bacterium]|nr:sigma-70 family RNA polymerase sigma factor [Lachnospiraceae bacterium]